MHLDVAIIGASSAGLYAAERLAQAGRRVAVFERQAALNHARRTYIITPQIRRVLGQLPEDVLLHQTPIMEVEVPGASTQVRLADPDLIIERRAMLKALAARAEAAGAEIRFGHRFISMTATPKGTAITLTRRDGTSLEVYAQGVIGADGAFSGVATAVGLPRPPLVQILQAEIKLPAGWNPEVTRVWFDTRDTRYFYWLIPENEQRGALGVIGDDGSDTRRMLDRFLQRQGVTPLAYQASHVAMYHPRLRPYTTLGGRPVILAGDAAGQVKVTTVGGSVTGFYGAAAAADILLGAAEPWWAFRHVRRELHLHWQIRRLLEHLDNDGYSKMISSVNPAIKRFLSERNRDEMAGAAWRIPLLQPKLVTVLLGSLLHGEPLTELQPIETTEAEHSRSYSSPTSAD